MIEAIVAAGQLDCREPSFPSHERSALLSLRPVFIKALYIGLVISLVAVLGVAAAIYVRVRKHMGDPDKHVPEREIPPGEQ